MVGGFFFVESLGREVCGFFLVFGFDVFLVSFLGMFILVLMDWLFLFLLFSFFWLSNLIISVDFGSIDFFSGGFYLLDIFGKCFVVFIWIF